MQLAYLAVAITIFGGNDTETQLSPQGIYSQKDCFEWQRNLQSVKPELVDPVSGRSIISRQFICQQIDVDDIADMVKKAREIKE